MGVKTTTKRQTKTEAELLDHATNNLLRALKQDMLKKEGRVDYDKLRKDGYSDRLLGKLGTGLNFYSFLRSRINSDTVMSSNGAALLRQFHGIRISQSSPTFRAQSAPSASHAPWPFE